MERNVLQFLLNISLSVYVSLASPHYLSLLKTNVTSPTPVSYTHLETEQNFMHPKKKEMVVIKINLMSSTENSEILRRSLLHTA